MDLSRRIDELLADLGLRAKSVIVTILGDGLDPHGGRFWLGSLIDLAALFGINERLVRTSVLRLAREDWLTARQVGRRSHYALTEEGHQRMLDSGRRIYRRPEQVWDGSWHLVLSGLGEIGEARRARLRRELRWLGFGAVGPNVFAHPSADLEALRHALKTLELTDEVVVMRGQAEALVGVEPSYDVLARAFDLSELGHAYEAFEARFAPFAEPLRAPDLEPRTAYRFRTVLAHEFRRLRLRDPQLPAQFLPRRWAGDRAWTLARDLYDTVLDGSEAYLMATVETESGPLPPPLPAFHDRFGGLGEHARVEPARAG